MWSIVCVCLAFFLYLVYNYAAISLFGVPESLSATYYLYQSKKNWLKILFPVTMILLACLLMPAWLEITVGNNFQFLSFFAAGSIMFTGAAPAFQNSVMEFKVHSISALISALCAVLWIIFGSGMWYFIPIWLAVISVIAFLTKTFKTSKVFWLETAAFLATFTSIIAYFFI